MKGLLKIIKSKKENFYNNGIEQDRAHNLELEHIGLIIPLFNYATIFRNHKKRKCFLRYNYKNAFFGSVLFVIRI